jgi:hypothetical protein
MRRNTKIFNLNHINNSNVDLSEKSSLRDIARGTQLRREAKDRRSFSNLILQQGLAKIIKIKVDFINNMGILISVDSLKGNNI